MHAGACYDGTGLPCDLTARVDAVASAEVPTQVPKSVMVYIGVAAIVSEAWMQNRPLMREYNATDEIFFHIFFSSLWD